MSVVSQLTSTTGSGILIDPEVSEPLLEPPPIVPALTVLDIDPSGPIAPAAPSGAAPTPPSCDPPCDEPFEVRVGRRMNSLACVSWVSNALVAASRRAFSMVNRLLASR